MLALTRKTDYALVALACLGKHFSAAGTGLASARKIASEYSLPLPLMRNVLKQLAQAEIVRSARGVRGGYSLAVDPHCLTVIQIIDAMEGPFRFAPCVDGLPVVDQVCPIEHICPIREPIRRLHSSLRYFFGQLTLADLLAGKTQVMLNPLTITNT